MSHEASRTGAPRVAVEVARALSDSGWEVHVCLRWGGPLRSEFIECASTVINEPLLRVRAILRRFRSTRRAANWLDEVGASLAVIWTQPELVWCNTVLSSCYIRPSLFLRRAVVLHAHEPLERMRQVLGRYKLGNQWDNVTLVACAPKVAEDLALAAGRPVDEVLCLPSVPDRARVLRLADTDERGYEAPRLLVGGCGSPNEGKGIDLWLAMVEAVVHLAGELDVLFIWIGGPAPEALDQWAERTRLGDRVRFTGLTENPYSHLATLSVFTLTSRADSFPLVVLEAMILKRPVVAFSVGDVSFQLGEAAHLHPVGAVDQMASDIVRLLRDPRERERIGEALAARAYTDFSIERFQRDVSAIAARAARRPPSSARCPNMASRSNPSSPEQLPENP